MSEGPKGVIWNSGKHDLYVDNEPAVLYASPESVEDTYNHMKLELNQGNSIPLGIDHLKEDIFKDNDILKKMDLLHVGDIHDVELLNGAINIKEAEITNPTIQELYDEGKLPAYSIVGTSKIYTCPNEGVDYYTDGMIVSRVDFVEKGGCETCVVYQPPVKQDINGKKGYISFNIYLKNKKSNLEENKSKENEDGENNMTKTKEEKIEKENATIVNKIEANLSETRLNVIEQELGQIKEQLGSFLKGNEEVTAADPEPEPSADPNATPEETVADFDVETMVQELIDSGLITEDQKDLFIEIGTKLGEELFTALLGLVTAKKPETGIQAKYGRNSTSSDKYDDSMKSMAKKYFDVELNNGG